MPYLFPSLILKDLSFTYPNSNTGITSIDLTVEPGTVHAVAGLSGAGKSTLAELLTGKLEASKGTIHLEGQLTATRELRNADMLGIRFVGSPRVLMGNESVADHLRLDGLPTRFGFIDGHEKLKRAEHMLQSFGILGLDPKAKMIELSAGMQRLVEVLSVFSKTSKLLILDDPSAPMRTEERDLFWQILDKQRVSGSGILLLTSSSEEAHQFGDRLSVLRDGLWISTRGPGEAFLAQINGEMLGYDPRSIRPNSARIVGPETVLRVEGISIENIVYSASFKLKRSEVLGIVGLQGAGQSELVRALVGSLPNHSGEVFLRGGAVPTKINSLENSLSAGIGFVPDLLGGYSEYRVVKSNLVSPTMRGLNQSNPIRHQLETQLANHPIAIALDNPTRGMSSGNRVEMLEYLPYLADLGPALVIASTSASDMIHCCDRIGVMVGGAIKQIFDRKDFDLQRIEKLMRGDSIR